MSVRTAGPRSLTQTGGCAARPATARFSVVDDIPEFIAGDLSASPDPQLRRMRFIDKMAQALRVAALVPGRDETLRRTAGAFAAAVGRIDCGHPRSRSRARSRRRLRPRAPSVERSPQRRQGGVGDRRFPRHAAPRASPSPRQSVLPICISPARGSRRCRLATRHFDAVICCGSLHLFTDTIAALKEMARVMKPGALFWRRSRSPPARAGCSNMKAFADEAGIATGCTSSRSRT